MALSAKPLKQTVLYDFHLSHQAKMSEFSGYAMPIQYTDGIKQEHLHTRSSASLFDVSHLGQCLITGAGSAKALETLLPQDILDLPPGKQRYSLITNAQGGIIDDIIVSRVPNIEQETLFIVVNAGNKERVFSHLQSCLPATSQMDILEDQALIALQGPKAFDVLLPLHPEIQPMCFMEICTKKLGNGTCYISRAGYTGEDGFEISLPEQNIIPFVEKLLDNKFVKPAGLGARDSLRLEAGLSLHGQDINEQTTPIEANLTWSISKVRRSGQARAGGFSGSEIILQQIDNMPPQIRLVGLTGSEKLPARAGAKLFNKEQVEIGYVTSGCFSPSLSLPIALGYVKMTHIEVDTVIFAQIRNHNIPLKVTKLPFVPHKYVKN